MQLLSEKENEIGSQKKANTSLESKLTALMNDVAELQNAKNLLESFILKAYDQIKGDLKDFDATMDELSLEKVLIDNKHKNLSQKLE